MAPNTGNTVNALNYMLSEVPFSVMCALPQFRNQLADRHREETDCKHFLTCLVTAGPSSIYQSHPNQSSSRSPPHQQGLTQQEPQDPWSLICLMVGHWDHCSRASKVSGRVMSSPNATLGKRRTVATTIHSPPLKDSVGREWLSPV